jgi:tRNA nucleotidyltransferase (CCA-adding enzyme)
MPQAFKVKLDSNGRVQASLDSALGKVLAPACLALLRAIITEADRSGLPIYLVGGLVRDLLLGRPNLDLDLVVEGDAIRFGRELVRSYGGDLQPHTPFGTAVWTLPSDEKALLSTLGLKLGKGKVALPKFIDLISARGETYAEPAALPSVRFADLHTDQYRRDFTINTLALGLNGLRTGQVIDAWRGLPDLKAGVLRTLHTQSFRDDPTRIFRILRFAGRLGFRIEADTQKQLKAALSGIKLLSGERVYNELVKVLEEPKREVMLALADRLGVLRQVHTKLEFTPKIAALLKRAQPAPADWEIEAWETDLAFVLWLMNLSAKDAAKVGERLRFDGNLQAAVVSATGLQAELPKLAKLKPSEVVALLEKEPLLAVYAIYLANKTNSIGKAMLRYAQKDRHIQSRADGSTLQKKGLKPGSAYKTILSKLRAAWIDGEVRTVKQESALLESLLNEHR